MLTKAKSTYKRSIAKNSSAWRNKFSEKIIFVPAADVNKLALQFFSNNILLKFEVVRKIYPGIFQYSWYISLIVLHLHSETISWMKKVKKHGQLFVWDTSRLSKHQSPWRKLISYFAKVLHILGNDITYEQSPLCKKKVPFVEFALSHFKFLE